MRELSPPVRGLRWKQDGSKGPLWRYWGADGAGHYDGRNGATSRVICRVKIACDSVRGGGVVVVGASLSSALVKVWGHVGEKGGAA